jgi:uroporphyrinogen decarboxylase
VTPRERILAVIHHERPDRIPCDFWGTPEVVKGLKKYLGVEEDVELWRVLGIDKIINLTPSVIWVPVSRFYVGPPLPEDQDIWGVRYQCRTYLNGKAAYWEVKEHPLAHLNTVEEVQAFYTFPKVDWFDFSTLVEECKRYQGYAIQCGYMSPFYTYTTIRGLEQAYIDLVENPEYVHFVLGKIVDFLYALHEKLFEAGRGYIDIAEVTEDLGTQRGLVMSLKMIEEFLVPHYRRLIGLTKSFGIKVFHHDDGAIRDVIPLLIDLGIEILNPIQWRLPGMDPRALKEDFGTSLCFHGGVDNQETLPFGSPEEVEKEACFLLETLASDGTGFIVAPCHNIQPLTPVENIVALYQAVNFWGWLR